MKNIAERLHETVETQRRRKLRAELAGMALQGLLSNDTSRRYPNLAETAVTLADELLEQLETTPLYDQREKSGAV